MARASLLVLLLAMEGSALKAKWSADTDNCECLPWRDVYSRWNTTCPELDVYSCENFMMKLPNENFCVKNTNMGFNEDWCYVRPDCEQGKIAEWGATPLLFRTCSVFDTRLGDKTVEELMYMSAKYDLEMQHLLFNAYPRWMGDEKMQKLLGYWNVSDVLDVNGDVKIPVYPAGEKVREKMSTLVESGRPTILMAWLDNYPRLPFAVVEGKKLWWINFGSYMGDWMGTNMKLYTDRLALGQDVSCIAGCKRLSPPWWSPLNHREEEQRGMLGGHQVRSPPNCECLGWKDAFKSGATCASMPGTVCNNFLMQLPNQQLCIKDQLAPSTNWCFVSPLCQDSSRSVPMMNGTVKECEYEPTLKDMTVNELDHFARQHDMDFLMAVKNAYEVAPTKLQLVHILAYFGYKELKFPKGKFGDENHTGIEIPYWIDPEVMNVVKTYISGHNTVLFPGDQGRPPYLLVEGPKLHWLNYGMMSLDEMKNGRFGKNPNHIIEHLCIKGCEKNYEPWLHPWNMGKAMWGHNETVPSEVKALEALS